MKKMLVFLTLSIFAAPAAVLADGAFDFKAKCAACHGGQANLLPKTARLLKVDPRKMALKASAMNKDEMIAVTEKGRGKMPGFEEELTKEQIAAIVDYIMALKKSEKRK